MLGLVVASLIDGKTHAQETHLVEQFAWALEVNAAEVKNLRHVLEGRDLAASSGPGAPNLVATESHRDLEHRRNPGHRDVRPGDDRPPGARGPLAYWQYCRDNGFALLGEKGGAAEQIPFHDCAHVLSGYGTDPEGEVQVACFSAGFQRREPWFFVFFVLLQFHLGIRMTPITKARTGFFHPEKALMALQRGAAMNVDLNDGWYYWRS